MEQRFGAYGIQHLLMAALIAAVGENHIILCSGAEPYGCHCACRHNEAVNQDNQFLPGCP